MQVPINQIFERQINETELFLENAIIMDETKPFSQNTISSITKIRDNDPKLVDELNTHYHNSISEFAKKAIQNTYPKATFYLYENPVGNHRPIFLVKTKDSQETFVIRIFTSSSRALSYLNEYEKVQEIEQRPKLDMLTINYSKQIQINYLSYVINNQIFISLSEFIGTESINFHNRDHLKLLIQLANVFIKQSKGIDLNNGNLVLRDGKMYYVDKDLNYGRYESPEKAKEAFLRQLSTIFNSPNYDFTDTEKSELYNYVCQNFFYA